MTSFMTKISRHDRFSVAPDYSWCKPAIDKNWIVSHNSPNRSEDFFATTLFTTLKYILIVVNNEK